MNVVAYRQGGCVYLCDFRNDYEKINKILKETPRKQELDTAWVDAMVIPLETEMTDAEMDKRWNDRMVLVMEVLEENGCTILWDGV